MKITLLLVLLVGVCGLSAGISINKLFLNTLNTKLLFLTVQDGKITIQGVKYYIHYSFVSTLTFLKPKLFLNLKITSYTA